MGGEIKLQIIDKDKEKKFCKFVVDDKKFKTEEFELTGGEIMDIAGIPRSVGLVQILEDGSQKPVEENEVIKFKDDCGNCFIKKPQFKRG